MKREFNVRRPSLGFDATSAEELAEIMCSLDYKLFRRIPVHMHILENCSIVYKTLML